MAETLISYVDRYALENDLASESVEQLKLRARLLTRYAGGHLELPQLTSDLVNRWLVQRQQQGLSPSTVAADRVKILTLWRAAHDSGLCASPGKVRTIKRPHKVPRAFTHEDIKKLLAVAERLKGNIRYKIDGRWYHSDVSRARYWVAWIMAAYDSALRRSDLLAVERNWIVPHNGGGIIGTVQSKTGRTQFVHFRAETMQTIDALCNGRTTGPIWCGYGTRRVWCQAFGRLCKAAGVAGSGKWLRRSSASYVARDYGKEAAKRHLGHATDGVADASYIDAMIAYPAPVLPPPIG